mmetsp:Transcript_11167/g.22655  ORF Transcript_11167/g.22655 Transcript_11167/m.22655 type:complete len:271 (+) Transcript_11167:232-1044(+)
MPRLAVRDLELRLKLLHPLHQHLGQVQVHSEGGHAVAQPRVPDGQDAIRHARHQHVAPVHVLHVAVADDVEAPEVAAARVGAPLQRAGQLEEEVLVGPDEAAQLLPGPRHRVAAEAAPVVEDSVEHVVHGPVESRRAQLDLVVVRFGDLLAVAAREPGHVLLGVVPRKFHAHLLAELAHVDLVVLQLSVLPDSHVGQRDVSIRGGLVDQASVEAIEVFRAVLKLFGHRTGLPVDGLLQLRLRRMQWGPRHACHRLLRAVQMVVGERRGKP